MTDHLAKTCAILDGLRGIPAAAIEKEPAVAASLLAKAQVHATLEVAEHVEFAGEQLRRLADAVEEIVKAWRRPSGILTVPGPLSAEDVERICAAVPDVAVVVEPDDEPCAVAIPPHGFACGVWRGRHDVVRDHEWIGAPLTPDGHDHASACEEHYMEPGVCCPHCPGWAV